MAFRLEFEDDELRRLAYERGYAGDDGWNPERIRMYRKRLQSLRSAVGLADLRNMQSLRFKQQDGQGAGLSSLHLGDGRRLILRILDSEGCEKVAVVVKVTDQE